MTADQRLGPPSADPAVPGPSRRVVWMDQARIAAIVFVVLIHSVAPLVYTRHGSRSWWVGIVLDSSASWAVPLFVMLSGALLLGGSGRQEGLGEFYRRRMLRVGVPAAFWIAAYFVFLNVFVGRQTTIGQYAVLVVKGTPYSHLYFLFVILGLYAVTPMLRVLVNRGSRRLVWVAAAMGVVGAWLNQLLLTFTHSGSQPWALTWFIPYLGYFLLGYLLRDVRLGRRAGEMAVAAYVLSVAGEAIFVYVTQPRWGLGQALYPLTKASLLTVVMSVSVFVIFRRVGELGWTVLPERSRRALSDAAFGVYLLHFMVLLGVLDHILGTRTPVAARQSLVLWVTTTVVSFAVVLVLRRIPVVRALV